MVIKKVELLVNLALVFCLTAFNVPQEPSQPNGYDLVAAVNAYRASKGYYALNPHPLVMSAAQAHAEWIVSTGQGGHIGPGGSDETMRVSWTGYGGGAAIKCDENWASSGSIEDAVYSAWSDWTHQEVMLNAWGNRYTDVGGGVAKQSTGRYVFVLDVCMIVGKGGGGTVPGATANPPATADFSNYIYGVTRATPMADGTIKHTVKYGQSLNSIADAYGTTTDSLRTLNNMAADETIIYPDQVLLIQRGNGSSAASTNTSTPAAPNLSPSMATPVPARTRQPTPSATAQSESSTPPSGMEQGQTLRNTGILLIGLCGLGLLFVLVSLFIKH